MQTPTLNFCVERHQAIVSFQPEPFWVVRPQVRGLRLCAWISWGVAIRHEGHVNVSLQL